ncbi:hypothetical protein C0J52_26434 [Blattella germanica]|nr:hypothetical protein C0J52_26434 [Blattella germanica]
MTSLVYFSTTHRKEQPFKQGAFVLYSTCLAKKKHINSFEGAVGWNMDNSIEQIRNCLSYSRMNSLMCHFEGEYMKFCSKKLWLDMSTIGHTAHIPPKVNFLPYSLKHIGRHLLNCSGDTIYDLFLKKKGTVELRHRIAAAVQQVTPDMLQRVWQEIDFRGSDSNSVRVPDFGEWNPIETRNALICNKYTKFEHIVKSARELIAVYL